MNRLDDPPPSDAANGLTLETLRRGRALLAELSAAQAPPALAARTETLLSLCALLLFRAETGMSAPLIGIMGSASSGKSTLFNSIVGADLALVTPIPHQTIGPILAVAREWLPATDHAVFLRPAVESVRSAPRAAEGLVGDPAAATVVPAWDEAVRAFALLDLPDIGTVDSREERRVALRLLPWLDRVILIVTEESFAQADHQEIIEALGMLRPERARADLFVVQNHRHSRTTEKELTERLEQVRRFWSNATVTALPRLGEGERFATADTEPLIAEAHTRAGRTLRAAMRNLAEELVGEVATLADHRRRELASLRTGIREEIREAARFRKAFFSNEFRKRLDAFSPWQVSVQRLRSLWGQPAAKTESLVDLLAATPVQRHLETSLAEIRERIKRRLEGAAGLSSLPLAAPDAAALEAAAGELVRETNERARHKVETLLNSLQEERRLKDPMLSAVTGVASMLFLLDLAVPSVGTLSSLTLLGAFSALGLGGVMTAEALRKLRTGQIKEFFEEGLRDILQRFADEMLGGPGLAWFDPTETSRRLSDWAKELPEG